MKKWIKRLSLSGAGFLGIIVILAFIGWRLMQGTPEWYRPSSLTPEQRAQASQRAINKLAPVQNEVAFARAGEIASRGGGKPPSTGPAHAGVTISLTDDEMNALFQDWSVWQSVRSSYDKFLTDPCIVLQDGRLILAGRVKELDAIASMHFEPRINQKGELEMNLVRVLAGKLPLPQAMFTKYQNRAADAINRRLPAWRQRARIDSTGVANSDAISAAMGEMIMKIMSQQPAEAIVFMHLVPSNNVPVKLADVQVTDHTLTLTVQPMTAAERAAFLERIRADRPVEAPAQ